MATDLPMIDDDPTQLPIHVDTAMAMFMAAALQGCVARAQTRSDILSDDLIDIAEKIAAKMFSRWSDSFQ